MIDLKAKQKEVFQNKLNKGFPIDDINREFCYLYGEVAEAFDAYRLKKDDLSEELADIVIFTLGIAEMLDIDLEDSLMKKIDKNNKRVYIKNEKGVLVKEGE
ncbi:MAG: hypothetical protein K2H20_01860 [Bacilli bacterium]|nr:hypothetical protein [Bacilli bacterium]